MECSVHSQKKTVVYFTPVNPFDLGIASFPVFSQRIRPDFMVC